MNTTYLPAKAGCSLIDCFGHHHPVQVSSTMFKPTRSDLEYADLAACLRARISQARAAAVRARRKQQTIGASPQPEAQAMAGTARHRFRTALSQVNAGSACPSTTSSAMAINFAATVTDPAPSQQVRG